MPLVMETVSNMFHRKSKTKTRARTPRRKFSLKFSSISSLFLRIESPVSTELRCYPLRLGPGVELVSTIHELMEDIGVRSLFILSCVGTISHCSLSSRQINKPGFEIVSLTGTFDSQSQHLMGSFADPQTGSLIGGKVHSLTVYSTCELMLAEPLDCTFFRELDPRTGHEELVVKKKFLTDY